MNSIRKQWDALQAAAADYRHEAAKALFNECRLGISERIAAEAIRLSRFGSADEELYNHCAWLMAAYKAAVAFCEEAGEDIVSPEVKEIIEGIVTILHSRLSEFEDAASVREESGNPIAEEKLAIVAQTLNSLEKAKPDEKVKIEIKQGAKWVKDGLMSVNQSLLEIAQSDVFPALHESYLKSLAVCQSRLNDFALRKTVQFYQAKMEDELEILSAIIKIQVKALEQDMNGDIEETPEKIAVHKILSMLREAYQRFGRAATVLSTIPGQPKQEPESYESFEAFLIDYWNQIEIETDSRLKAQINTFKTKIEKEAELLLGKCRLTFLKSQNHFRQAVNKEISLANKMTGAFVVLQDNWPKLEAEDEGAEILKGVAETLEIKIDGLRESISQMEEECASTIESFASENAAPSDEAVMAAKAAVWQLWLESDNVNAFKQNCCNLPFFEERRLHHEKSAARYQEIISKKLLKFMRETVLYEISTYEEIIFYSITRLRQLEQVAFQQAASLADDTLHRLEHLLENNGIEIIRPQPHEPFNSKEHEVLMAETNPDFKKGEIIKMMNSGYRQNDVILLRANVIAAR